MFHHIRSLSERGDESRPRHFYDKLDAASKEIRLLQVRKGSHGELECHMETFSLAYTPENVASRKYRPFLAISYTWGRTHPWHTIQLNGRPFKVRPNLNDLLEFLASKEKRCHYTYEDLNTSSSSASQRTDPEAAADAAREQFDFNPVTDVCMHEPIMDYYLSKKYYPSLGKCNEAGPWWWIDAICIDQENIEEREQQVAIMAEIYSGAVCVLSWLGPEPLDQDFISHMSGRKREYSGLESSSSPASRGDFANWTSAYTGGTSFGGHADELLASRTVSANASLTELLSRGYWDRVWIVQESILAKHLLICTGLDIMPWDNLAYAAFSTKGNDGTAGFRVLFERSIFCYNRQFSHALPLTIMTWRFQQCKDPRDKIYAMLGVTSPNGHRPIYPNYRLGCEDLFAQVISNLDLTFNEENLDTWYNMRWGSAVPSLISVISFTLASSPAFLQFCAELCKMLGVRPSHPTVMAAVMSGITRGRTARYEQLESTMDPKYGRRSEAEYWAGYHKPWADYSPETAAGQRIIRERLEGVKAWQCHPLDWHRDPTIKPPTVFRKVSSPTEGYHSFPLFPGEPSIR